MRDFVRNFQTTYIFKLDAYQRLTLLNTLGANVQPTKSGVYANINGVIWGTHRPHPRPYLDKAAVVGLRKALTAANITPKALGCVC